jgi:alkylation response protein AidB-like acyl-CoA dehydrogenase
MRDDKAIKPPSRGELVARAQALAPKLRERAAQAEQLRRVPEETLAEAVAAGLTRIVQPSRYGGFDMGWDDLCATSMELARGCGSQAWVVNIFGEHNFLVGLFDDQAQSEVWGSAPDTLVSSALIPVADPATRQGDGYVLNGRWPFLSGIDNSSWTILGALVPRDDDTQEHHFFLVPAADREIVDDWHTMGMAGTGSKSVRLDHVFVPAHRALANRLVVSGTTPGAAVNPAPVFRMPMIGYSLLALASVVVGMAECMVEAFTGLVETRAASGQPRPGGDAPFARIAEAAAEAQAARLLILDAAGTNMAKLSLGKALGADDQLVSRRNGAYGAALARRAATRLYEAAGAHEIYLDGHMQRCFRDIYAATAHTGLAWDRTAVEYGRHQAGLSFPPLF